MVKSGKLYSPQSYLEMVTGNCYIVDSDNDVEFVEKILEELGYCLWSHALDEIDEIVENELDVVLVDCMIYNANTKEFQHVYRWFEVDEDTEIEEEPEIPIEVSPGKFRNPLYGVGETVVFNTTQSDLTQYNGLNVVITEVLSGDECDVEDVGFMYRVETGTGDVFQAFEDELTDF